ncbi:MAG: hypothetical protein JWP29_2059 [Rhodoferax sp.]|nr:hypothetical protein [Rhodoferax sp.]
MLQSFGWIIFLVIGVVVIGLGITLEMRRRKRAAAERKAVWKAHQDWLRNSAPHPPGRDLPPRAKNGGPGHV